MSLGRGGHACERTMYYEDDMNLEDDGVGAKAGECLGDRYRNGRE